MEIASEVPSVGNLQVTFSTLKKVTFQRLLGLDEVARDADYFRRSEGYLQFAISGCLNAARGLSRKRVQ